VDNEDPVLNLDCANIAAADPTLYSHLLSCPTEVIPLMDTEARNLAAALGGDDDADHHIQVCPAHGSDRPRVAARRHVPSMQTGLRFGFLALQPCLAGLLWCQVA
jgi:hypothetical protein